MAWLAGWQYRKSHIINPQTGAGTNYQIKITVHYGSGSDGDDDVYCNSHCRTDFGDIRFTDDNGTTLLDYWIESKVDSDYAVIWVEVADSLESSSATIYVYYGKADATYPFGNDQDKMNATFLFADHFYGTVLDPSKWTEYGNGTASVASSEVTVIPTTGAYGKYIGSANNFGVGTRCFAKAKMYTFGAGSNEVMFVKVPRAGPLYVTVRYTLTHPTYFAYEAPNIEVDSDLALDNNYHRFEVRRITATSTKHLIDDAHLYSGSPSSNSDIIGLEILAYYGYAGQTTKIIADYIFVTKVVDPEPTHGAWGIEEILITRYETLNLVSELLSPRFQYLKEIVNLSSRVWTNPFWIFERTSLSDLFWRVNPFFLEGFESNSFLTNGWTTYTRCSIVQSPVHHGGYAVRIQMVNGTTVYLSKSISSTRHLSVRCYFRMSNFPTGTEFKIIDLRSGSNFCGSFNVTSSYWRVYGTYSSQIIYSPTPQLDTWYGIELEYHQVSGTTYRVKGYLNGVKIADITDTYNDWAVNLVYFQYGSNASYTVFYDDIAFDYNSIGSTFDPVGSFGRSCYERLTATKNIQQVGTFGSSLELQYSGALIVFPYTFTSPRILYAFGLRCVFGGNYYHKAVVYKTEGANLILYAIGPSAYLLGNGNYNYWFPSFSPPVYLEANTTYYIGFFRDGPGYNYPAQGQGTSTTMYRLNPGGYPNPPYYFEGYSTSSRLYGICVIVAEIGETFRLNIFKTCSQLLSLLDFFLFRKTLLEILNLASSMIMNISKNLMETLQSMEEKLSNFFKFLREKKWREQVTEVEG